MIEWVSLRASLHPELYRSTTMARDVQSQEQAAWSKKRCFSILLLLMLLGLI
jgi:hypothetical protein